MKKKIILSFILASSLLLLSACNSQSNGQASNAKSGGDQAGTSAAGRQMRRPDFGQPDKQPDIRGLVKSAVGNEVTILKIDIKSRNASSTPDNAGAENRAGAATSGSVSLSAGGVASGRMMAGGGPGGGFGGGPGGQAGQNSATRAQMIAKLKEMSTGEEKIIIPVGIKMMKAANNSKTGEREMVEATLSDVTADKNITVWLNTEVTDKKVADFVLIN